MVFVNGLPPRPALAHVLAVVGTTVQHSRVVHPAEVSGHVIDLGLASIELVTLVQSNGLPPRPALSCVEEISKIEKREF